jgi:hypothetical protein
VHCSEVEFVRSRVGERGRENEESRREKDEVI